MSSNLAPGTIVLGPFYSDGRQGLGVIAKVGRPLWSRVSDPSYAPVRVIKGDRINGGYNWDGLTPVPEVTLS